MKVDFTRSSFFPNHCSWAEKWDCNELEGKLTDSLFSAFWKTPASRTFPHYLLLPCWVRAGLCKTHIRNVCSPRSFPAAPHPTPAHTCAHAWDSFSPGDQPQPPQPILPIPQAPHLGSLTFLPSACKAISTLSPLPDGLPEAFNRLGRAKAFPRLQPT